MGNLLVLGIDLGGQKEERTHKVVRRAHEFGFAPKKLPLPWMNPKKRRSRHQSAQSQTDHQTTTDRTEKRKEDGDLKRFVLSTTDENGDRIKIRTEWVQGSRSAKRVGFHDDVQVIGVHREKDVPKSYRRKRTMSECLFLTPRGPKTHT